MEQLIIDIKNVGYVKIFKDEMKNTQDFEHYKNLPNAKVEREDTNDEFVVFKTFRNPQNFTTYKISQYNKYFNEHCADFGTFSDYEVALEAMINGFDDLYPGFTQDFYKNGDNQWISDRFDFGVMIEEIQFEITNTFGEV